MAGGREQGTACGGKLSRGTGKIGLCKTSKIHLLPNMGVAKQSPW